MSNDNVVNLIQPGTLTDQLTDVLRNGARVLLIQALEAEVSEFLAGTADLKTQDGCRRLVRHGHLPEREIMTGIGPVAVRQPRVRDRTAGADDPARIRFAPTILPPATGLRFGKAGVVPYPKTLSVLFKPLCEHNCSLSRQ